MAKPTDKEILDYLDRGPVWKMEKRYDTTYGTEWPVFFKPCFGFDEHRGRTAREAIILAMKRDGYAH